MLSRSIASPSSYQDLDLPAHIPVIFYSVEAITNRALYISDSVRNFGYEPEDFFADPALCNRIVPEDEREFVACRYAELAALGKPFDLVHSITNGQTGRIHRIHSYVTPVLDETGQILRQDGVAIDITREARLQNEIVASRDRFPALFENTAVGILITTIDGKFLEVNDRLAKMLGFTPAELLQMNYRDVQHPDQIEWADWQMRQIWEGKVKSFHVEKPLIRKDGRAAWFNICVTSVTGDDGRPAQLVAMVVDIDERKTAERELLESRKKFRHMYQNAVVGLYRSTINPARIVECNHHMADILGYASPEECARECVVGELYDPPEQRTEFIRRLLEHGELRDHEARVRRKNGELIWVRYAAFLNREAGYIDGFAVDCTLEKESIEHLRESERRYRGLIESQDDLIYRFGPDLVITFTTETILRRTGEPLEQVVGQPLERERLGEDYPLFLRAVNSVHKAPHRCSVETRFFLPNETLHVHWVIYGICNDAGDIVEYQVVGRDLTELRQLQEEMLKNARLTAIGEAMASLSHGLKNTYSALSSTTTILKHAVKTSDLNLCRESVDILERCAKRQYHLFSNLLDFSKARKVLRERTRVSAIVDEVIDFLNPIRVSLGVEVRSCLSDSADLLYVDSERLFSALLNLGINALDAMPDGGCLTFESTPAHGVFSQNGGGLAISVRDTGQGIPPDIRERIFDPFFSSKGSSGTGLGLASVRQFAMDFDGRIELDSAPGEGTTFTLFLPSGDSHSA